MVNYQEYYVKEAMFHMDKAKEILEEGMKDPQKFYHESQHQAKVMYNSLPYIILTEQILSHKVCSDKEENSPDTIA